MMAHAELAEAKCSKRFFAFFDDCKALWSNFNAVCNARRQAGGSRTVPDGQIRATGEFTDVSLGQAGIEQRRQDAMVAGSPLAGAPIALIVDVHAVCHSSKPALRGKLIKLSEKLVFAEKATVRIVSAITGVRNL